MNVYIKNMVCLRCVMVVQSILSDLDIRYSGVELGLAKLADTIQPDKLRALNEALKLYDLELMDDRKKILVEQIKVLIVRIFHSTTDDIPHKFSEYLSKVLYYDYTYLSNLFSELEGSTIEKFYIVSRVERAKELMVYDSLTTTEIAYKLNYSSVSHFCLQFKKITGQTPATYKKLCQSENFVWRKL